MPVLTSYMSDATAWYGHPPNELACSSVLGALVVIVPTQPVAHNDSNVTAIIDNLCMCERGIA